jgi:DnaK suppressor protein
MKVSGGMNLMDIEYFRKRLRERERELLSILSRVEEEARVPADVEVRDLVDNAAIDEQEWVTVEQAEIASRELAEVREALDRIDKGTYGKCIVCGRQIEPERLEAVPWTPYCLDDQQEEDARRPIPRGVTL